MKLSSMAMTTILLLSLIVVVVVVGLQFTLFGNIHNGDDTYVVLKKSSSRIIMQTEQDDNIVKDYMLKMNLMDKIGQMSQMDISTLVEENDDDGRKKQLSMDKVNYYIGELGVGSVLNFVSSSWTPKDYRQAIIEIQKVAHDHGHPPVIWGIDSVHGANYLLGALVTPQPLNLAATFNDTCAKIAGQLASRDTRAAGLNWLFSPLLGIAVQPKWSRNYETFGEDPFVVQQMAQAMIHGIQLADDKNNIPSQAAASAKHFVGYSFPHNGHDRSPSWIPTRHLYQYFVPPWKFVLTTNSDSHKLDDTTTKQLDHNIDIPMTVMESYTDYDGVPNVANTQSLQYLLRQQLQYNGMVVTDYAEIYNLHEWHHITNSSVDAVIYALQRGDTLDMSMIPIDYESFKDGILLGFDKTTKTTTHAMKLKQSRIDRSVKRVLQLKANLNMFHETLTMENNENLDKFTNHDAIDIETVYEMAYQSFVLVKNKHNKALPLSANDKHKIMVTGPTAHSLVYQTGGWTGEWQGTTEIPPRDGYKNGWFNETISHTIWEYLQLQTDKTDDTTWNVEYLCGVDILGHDCSSDNNNVAQEGEDDSIPSSIRQVGESIVNTKSDTIIICLGEEANTEKPGDIHSLQLPSGQEHLVQYIDNLLQKRSLRNKTKLIVVYLGGRAKLLKDIVDHVDAILIGFLPGPSGGRAFYDILVGKVNPSGRLPISYPYYDSDVNAGIPYFHAVSDQCTKKEDPNNDPLPQYPNKPCSVQWPFGYGLSYTTFEYSNLQINTNLLTYYYNNNNNNKDTTNDSILTVSITIKNTGSYDGSETVLFYTFDQFRSVTPEYKRLRYYQKIFIPAGSFKSVTMTLHAEDLKFVGPEDDTHYILQDGLQFKVGIGAKTDCRRPKNNNKDSKNLCSDIITIQTQNNGNKNNRNKNDNNDLYYIPACEAACNLWKQSGCVGQEEEEKEDPTATTTDNNSGRGGGSTTATMELMPSMSYCYDLCSAVSNDDNNHFNEHADYSSSLEQSRNGWGWNYVHCLESVIWGFQYEAHDDDIVESNKNMNCWKMTALCRNVFTTPLLDEYGSACPAQEVEARNAGDNGTSATLIFVLVFGISSVIIFLIYRYHPQNNNGITLDSDFKNLKETPLPSIVKEQLEKVPALKQRVQAFCNDCNNSVTPNSDARCNSRPNENDDYGDVQFTPVAATDAQID